MKKKITTQKRTTAADLPALTQEDIQTCLDHAQAIANVLAPYAVMLTTAERRAQTKYRREGDTVIPTLARLAKTSGLVSTALDVDTMQKQVALAATLQPLHSTVKTLCDTIGDTVLSAHGDSWHTATTLHSALVRVSKKNPGLRRDMEVVSGAFTNRKKSDAQSASAPAATADATATAQATPAEPTAPATTPATPAPTATLSKGA